MDLDEHGPRSTAEAYALLRQEALEKLLSHPELLPKPWAETRPNGWPIAEAVFAFAHESARYQVSLHLGMAAEGYPDRVILGRLVEGGWQQLSRRLSRGELIATGTPDGELAPGPIDQSLFDGAELDQQSMRIVVGSRQFLGVRVFNHASAKALFEGAVGQRTDKTPSILPSNNVRPTRPGPEPRHGDDFLQEIVRFALTPDGFQTRKQLELHMKEWCNRTRAGDRPDDRTIERWIVRYCPPEIPTN